MSWDLLRMKATKCWKKLLRKMNFELISEFGTRAPTERVESLRSGQDYQRPGG